MVSGMNTAPALLGSHHAGQAGDAVCISAHGNGVSGDMTGKDTYVKALSLVVKTLGIYGCFILWGLIQEKVTTTKYLHRDPHEPPARYTCMISLNASMALTASLVGFLFLGLSGGRSAPLPVFWKSALSNTLASPIGYLSLRHISFPLLLLTKNMKMVPVMLVGALINGRRYKPYEIVSVLFISIGVATFMLGKGGKGQPPQMQFETPGSMTDGKATFAFLVHFLSHSVSLSELRGLCLALTNLLVDGYTNGEQDRINAKYKVSPFCMMAKVNAWSFLFALTYLFSELGIRGSSSELSELSNFIPNRPGAAKDLALFSFSNAIGQLFIFSTIAEFGALTTTTITVTRKMLNVILSIIVNRHPVNLVQWTGIASVATGLGTKIVYGRRPQTVKAKKEA